MNSRQRANKATELDALCSWRATFGSKIEQDPLFEQANQRANELVEQLCNYPLFPDLEGGTLKSIFVYSVVNGRRKRKLGALSAFTTVKEVQAKYGPGKLYIEPREDYFGGTVLAGGRIL